MSNLPQYFDSKRRRIAHGCARIKNSFIPKIFILLILEM